MPWANAAVRAAKGTDGESKAKTELWAAEAAAAEARVKAEVAEMVKKVGGEVGLLSFFALAVASLRTVELSRQVILHADIYEEEGESRVGTIDGLGGVMVSWVS